VPDNDFDSYFGHDTSQYAETEKSRGPPSFIGTFDPKNLFADPVLPLIDEAIIKRMSSPKSVPSSVETSPRLIPGALSPGIYVDRPFVTARPSPLKKALKIEPGKEGLVGGPSVRAPPKHREGEEVEVPMSPESVFQYYEAT
jgi:hypothetical protein